MKSDDLTLKDKKHNRRKGRRKIKRPVEGGNACRLGGDAVRKKEVAAQGENLRVANLMSRA